MVPSKGNDLALRYRMMTAGEQTMRASWAIIVLFAAILSAASAVAAVYWRQPGAMPGFGGVREELQRLVDTESHERLNHFCVVVEDVHESPSPSSEGNSRQLIVYWPEGGHIYTYGPADSGRIGPGNRDEGADIDLHRDVVTSEKKIAGSTTRVTRAFVGGLIAHCRQGGVRYTIVRNRR